jgi:glycosyltransferase involved in cell wall biosynthesis
MEKQLRIGFIGTLSYHKGAHVLAEAVRKLSADKRFKVKIYGALEQFPEYAEILRAIAGEDERIEFCGTFPHDKIGEVLNGIDVLIVSSLWYENTPLVIHSAQAAKVPVVATNLGGMNEVVINGVNGFLFEKGDAGGLAEIILTLCNNASLVERLSNHARTPKSILTYADELEELYSEVMEFKSKA